MHNNARMQKACTSGLRKAKGKAASRLLKTAVKNLHTAVQKNAKHAKQVKSFKEVHKLMMKEIDVAVAITVAKIKAKYTSRELKKGNDGALMARRLHVRVKSFRGMHPVGWKSRCASEKTRCKSKWMVGGLFALRGGGPSGDPDTTGVCDRPRALISNWL